MQTEYDYNNEPEIDEMGKPYKTSEFSFWDEVGYWGGWFVTVLAVLFVLFVLVVTVLAVLGLITLILTCNG